MVPSSAYFKKLLRDIYRSTPDTELRELQMPDGSVMRVSERQVLISCVVSAAEATERLEKVITEIIAPKLSELRKQAGQSAEPPAAAAPGAAEEEYEDMPPFRAETTRSEPAAPPPPAAQVSHATIPVNQTNNGQVTVSAPQPIPPKPAPAV